MTRSPSFAMLLLGVTVFCACAEVRPWERGALAEPAMDPAGVARLAAQDFVRHTFDVREGSTGGGGHAGGGCGCN